MPVPGFTATESCYRSGGARGIVRPRMSDSAARYTLVPATFHCANDGVCTCEGLDNCIQMFSGPLCSDRAACDSTSGLVCGCLMA
jgi:hypothetical protein